VKSLALLATVAGIAVVAACSQTSQTSAPQASPGTITHFAGPVNCHQSYDAWARGPAKEVIVALNEVGSVGGVGDIRVQTAALKKAGPALVTAGSYPIPACADPKGYWNALLMHVSAAANSVKSADGAAPITAALKGVPQLERKLSAELRRTAGVK
jgi:ABC-type glycerol-3-phosphate transport system substrate-binding protein